MLEYSVIAGLIGLASIVGLKSAGSTAQQTAAIITGELGGEVNGGDDWEDGLREGEYIDENGNFHWVSIDWMEINGETQEVWHDEWDEYTPIFDEHGNPVMVQEVDDDGNLVYDDNGDPVYVQATESKYYDICTDADGNVIYTEEAWTDTNLPLFDENGNMLLDEDGNPLSGEEFENGVRHSVKTDADGNIISRNDLWGESFNDEEELMYWEHYDITTDANGNIIESEKMTFDDELNLWHEEILKQDGQLISSFYDEDLGAIRERIESDDSWSETEFSYNDDGIFTGYRTDYSDGSWAECIQQYHDNGQSTTQINHSDGTSYNDVFDEYGNTINRRETYPDGSFSEKQYEYTNRYDDDEGLISEVAEYTSTGRTSNGIEYSYNSSSGGSVSWTSNDEEGRSKSYAQTIGADGSIESATVEWSEGSSVMAGGTDYRYTQNADGTTSYEYRTIDPEGEVSGWTQLDPNEFYDSDLNVDHSYLYVEYFQ